MTFDYDSPGVPDTAVSDVVKDIINNGKLPPLSDEEKNQRKIENEIYRWECQQRDEERAIEYRERQEEQEALARAEQAAEIAERNRQRRLQQQREYMERAEHRSRSLDLSALKFEAQQQGQWRAAVQQDLRRQHVMSLYGELEKMLTPPAEPESQLIDDVVDVASEGSPDLGSRDFNPALFNKKPRRWF